MTGNPYLSDKYTESAVEAIKNAIENDVIERSLENCMKVEVDFTDYPEALEIVEKQAKKNRRPVANEIIVMCEEYMKLRKLRLRKPVKKNAGTES